MIKLIIFDLDGTLLNTIRDLGESVNYALARCGFATHPIERYPRFVGNGVTKLIERTLPEESRDEAMMLKVKAHFVEYYDQHNACYTTPYNDIPELLNEMRDRGVALAVASNKYHSATQKLVEHYFPTIPFCIVLGQREGVAVKPDPQIVYDILDETRLLPDETLYVGDSGVDMQTARRAGIRSVGVTWGFRPESELIETEATYIVENPKEIIDICNRKV